jgi:hypothetical protein
MTRILLLPTLALLLTACTGTEEGQLPLRLAVLTDGGATARTVTTGRLGTAPAPAEVNVSVVGGAALDTLPGGRRVALTLAAGIESRDANLADARAFAPPFDVPGFTPPCLKQTVLNAQRDRLLTLSQCDTAGVNGTQQLALYRVDGTLVWRAALPASTPPAPGPDVPPVRLALLRENGVDLGIVARPALGGGSEVLRVAAPLPGSDRADVSSPLPTPAIRDLAPAAGGALIYAATDTGVQPLAPSGTPDAGGALSAFGTGRVDRLWTSAGSGTGGSLIAAWRGGTDALLLSDGTRAAATVTNLSDLRDLTFAPDGFLYALTGTALTSYDTVIGLGQGNWRPASLLGGLNDARAVTWLVP